MITGWKYLEGVNSRKGRDETSEELQYRGSLCLSSVEGFRADVKADFLTAGSA